MLAPSIAAALVSGSPQPHMVTRSIEITAILAPHCDIGGVGVGDAHSTSVAIRCTRGTDAHIAIGGTVVTIVGTGDWQSVRIPHAPGPIEVSY